jgi:hypothetical protein
LFAGPNNFAWVDQKRDVRLLTGSKIIYVENLKSDQLLVGSTHVVAFASLEDTFTTLEYTRTLLGGDGTTLSRMRAPLDIALLDDGVVSGRRIDAYRGRFVRTDLDGKGEAPIFAGWEGYVDNTAFDGTRLVWLTPGTGPVTPVRQFYSNMWMAWPKEPERPPVKLLTNRKDISQLIVDERGVAWVEMTAGEAPTWTLYAANFV